MINMSDIKELYSAVFDEHGEIKLCGREACKRLISACLERNPNGDFGDINTGMMNVANIKEFYQLL